jgi:UDP-3-O-[3-hydroxymyristoyl] glucosamine N-acyltransferase
MELTVAQIAERLKTECPEGGDTLITGMAGVRDAGPGDITFIENPQYYDAAETSRAGAILVARHFDRESSSVLIRVDDVQQSFREVIGWYAIPQYTVEPGIHETAIIADDAQLGEDVHIGPHVVIESGAVIGNRTVIMSNSYIGHQVRVGEDCILRSNVVIQQNCIVGDRVSMFPGVVIGSDGFGYDVDASQPVPVVTKIPHVGIVRIGNDCEFGANTCIDRARFGETRIGNHVKFDNLVQVAHNCVIGDYCGLTAQVGVSGSTRLGMGVQAYGQSGFTGHLSIGDRVIVWAKAGVATDLPSGIEVSGFPAISHRQRMRHKVNVTKIPDMRKQIRALEEELARLKEQLGEDEG